MNFLLNMFIMLANEATTGTGTGTGSKGIGDYWLIIVMGVLIVGMVVMTIIPNKRRQKEYQRMQDEIRPGTKVMTIGRMIGTVVRIYDNNTLEVDVGTPGAPVVITINREAIGVNLDAQAAAQAAKNGGAPAATADSAPVEGDSADVSALPQEESALPQEESDLPVEPESKPGKKPKKDDDSI